MSLTPDERKEIEAAIDKDLEIDKAATPAPWFSEECHTAKKGETCWCKVVMSVSGSDKNEDCVIPYGSVLDVDADAIAHARNTLAVRAEQMKKLLAALDDAERRERERIADRLERVGLWIRDNMEGQFHGVRSVTYRGIARKIRENDFPADQIEKERGG